MSRRARTEQAKEDRKKVLMGCALKLLAANGYQGTRIEMITAEAGLSTGTFYLYFKSKTDLYRQLYWEGMEILQQELSPVSHEKPADNSAAIEQLALHYYNFYLEHNEYYKVLYILYLGNEDEFPRNEFVEMMDKKALSILDSLREPISRGMESGEFAPTDPWAAACSLWAAIDGVIMLNERGNIPLIGTALDVLVRQMLAITLNGLRSRS